MLEILLVDDEPAVRLSLGDALANAGHSVTTVADGAEAMEMIRARVFDVVVSDIRLPKIDGLTVFRRLRAEHPGTAVILITAYATVADAVSALKEGAHDYLTKPFDTDEMVLRVARIDERRALERALEEARSALASSDRGPDLIGRSPALTRLLDRVDAIAASDASVLITGESGTGKELVARRLHARSPRHKRPFVPVNCASFPETLLEAELFGHERGAFTGAVKRREGRFAAANGGTLFLDEVADIPLPAQAKLLRVLQEGTFEPIGTNVTVEVDVRVVSATHRNLKEAVAEGRFRDDLYYRLNVMHVEVPPLRERRGDLPLLVEHMMRRYASGEGPSPTISPRAWAALSAYPFPGNVRELEHAIQHAVVLARGREIQLDHLPSDLVATALPEPAVTATGGEAAEAFRTLAAATKEFEREYLLRALAHASGVRARAAEYLGISRKNLWEKLRFHGIDASEAEDGRGSGTGD